VPLAKKMTEAVRTLYCQNKRQSSLAWSGLWGTRTPDPV